MAFDGNGIYSPPSNSWNPSVDGTDISTTDWAAILADLSTALSTTITKDGQTTPTANIPMGGFRLTGLGAATTAGDALSYGGAAVLAATVITSASANAFDVGPNGATNPVLQVDASTSSAATGLKLKAAAAAAGVAISVLSSGTDESLSIDAKGAGSLVLQGTATGPVSIPVGQIKFPSSANPSSNANTLDAYQEGTFTFTDASGQAVAITNTYSHYQLIGNTCYISCTAVFGSSAVATQAIWTGLPFTVKNSAGNGAAGIVYGRTNTAVIPNPGNAFVSWVGIGGGNVNDSDLSGLTLRFQFSYEIA